MSGLAVFLIEMTGELSLFAAVGFLIFALDDLVVDLIYFTRRGWRDLVVYSRHPRTFGDRIPRATRPGWMAVFIPAWDESKVIADMLNATLRRFGDADYRLFVGHYRNDPATAAAIATIDSDKVTTVNVDADGPTTKADCLNNLFVAMEAEEERRGCPAKAVILHDAEDVVHPKELAIFDLLAERAGAIQLPVVPLIDADAPWVSGHYADEFAESHGKDLVVREAVGASIPLAGVGCAIERRALGRLACRHQGRPFSGGSMTEDYEMGLRLGAIGVPTIFVRIPAEPGVRGAVATRGHFPSTIPAAVRQKARWIGGIAFAGWDQLGWRGGLGERWMRMRDRRGPLAAMLIAAGYAALFLWALIAFAGAMGAPVAVRPSPLLQSLLLVNAILFGWRLLMRVSFSAAANGWREGLRAIPRVVVGNIIAVRAAWRALRLHDGGGPKRWDKTDHVFPKGLLYP